MPSGTPSPRRTSPGVAATGAEHLDGGAVSSQFRDRLETGGSRRPALEPVSVNAVGPGSGCMADTHQGGRQFASQDDADWKNMEAWVRGQKASGSSAP